MPYTINLHLLENKQIKVDKGGIPLGNENSYRIYEHEENVTQFEIVSKPAEYENADYYVIFINSQNKRAFLDDIIPDPVTDDGQLIVDDTFMLPIGMAVKGYGYIRIYAIQDNERVEFQPIKIKVWDTVETWKDYVTELSTPATENWVEDYVDNALAEIDLSGYVQKTTTIAGIDLQGNITKSELLTALNVEDGAEVNTVDSVNGKTGTVVLDADDISDTNTTNKFISAEEKAQITTNKNDIETLETTVGDNSSGLVKTVNDNSSAIATIETSYGATLEFTVNSSTYVLTAILKNKDGTALSTQTVDLPLESVVVSGEYDDNTKSLILTLQNGNTITIPVGDLISGLVSESRTVNGHALSSDITITKGDMGLGNVDNTSDLNKPVSTAQRQAIDDLQQKIENGQVIVSKSLTTKAIENISEESGTIQEEPFIIQGTGTNNNTSPVDTSPIGKQLEKQGNTIVYNQLLPISSKESVTTSGITFTNNNDGSWTINGTADGNAYDVILSTIVTYIKGHTYILFGNQGQGSLSTFYLADNYSGNYIHQDYGKGVIFTIYQDSIRPNIAIRVLNGTTVNNVKIVPKLTDLTKWFNGNENIPQDLLSHPEHWGWYYNGDLSYSKGELRNCAGRYLECGQGRNIYNPEETYNRVIPNIEYYYYGGSATTITYYDKDQTVISTESVSSGNTFTTPSNCVYINSSVTSNITISEYYSTGEEYDEYYPYVPPVTYDTGTEVLRRVNSVKDTKEPDGTITRRIGTRAYESGDESNSDVLTDGTTTYYILTTPTTEQGTTFSENIEIDDYSDMGWLDNSSYVAIPQGCRIFYPADYVLLLDSLNSYTNGNITSLAKKSEVVNKADKVENATSGNFAGLDSNGNLTDSGKSASDFTAASSIDEDFFSSLY